MICDVDHFRDHPTDNSRPTSQSNEALTQFYQAISESITSQNGKLHTILEQRLFDFVSIVIEVEIGTNRWLDAKMRDTNTVIAWLM